jgi:diaminopimelate epimerase
MKIKFEKYQGAGNDFIIIDNRKKHFLISNEMVHKLCDRKFGIGADGLILIEKSKVASFEMLYYNADGKLGSMCGNGARCVVAFAHQNKIVKKETIAFKAFDGIHSATILENKNVILMMSSVTTIEKYNNDYILNTGSPHYVKFVSNINKLDVYKEGLLIRNSNMFKKEGINVNFVEVKNNALYVRTFERGVEDETLSCGTGVVASAVVSNFSKKVNKQQIQIHTLGGELLVSFKKNRTTLSYESITLEGPAKKVYNGEFKILEK